MNKEQLNDVVRHITETTDVTASLNSDNTISVETNEGHSFILADAEVEYQYIEYVNYLKEILFKNSINLYKD